MWLCRLAAKPAWIKAPGPPIGMHGPSLGVQENRLERLHARPEGIVCFWSQTALKVLVWNRRETVIRAVRSGNFSSGPAEISADVGIVKQYFSVGVLCVRVFACSKGLWRNSVGFLLTCVYTCLKRAKQRNKLFIHFRYIYLCYIFIYWRIYFYS